MRIAAVASAFPEHHYPQEVLVEALQKYFGEKLANPQRLERIYSHMGVEGRYLTLPLSAYYNIASWGDANDAFIAAAPVLGQQSLCRALAQAGLNAPEIATLIVVSVTGIASPSLDALLVNRMGLSPNIKRVPIFGLGCVAGAAGISRAADYVRAYPSQVAALLAVELCSLTIQRDDLSIANLISAALFGDGAAAVLVTGSDRDADGPEILATRSVFYPQTEHVMGWDISEKGFTIVLSPEVPAMVERHWAHDVDQFLGDMGLTRKDIGTWILHSGGPKVLEAMAATLKLPDGALDASWECLRRVGNISSVSVLLVLEEIMNHRPPASGSLSLLGAMGPGFCSELVLLRWS
ncbi:MAG TPA: 3-oxoacyl-[acyl-carrier-protein] synthase III C-terminal domain-containing protein [Terriglobia bacterium]|nr:3-oxoacyl-[acyl-carrier-protein] synthase III C-terminal domain-containing protein [Terriglobia bacterium]